VKFIAACGSAIKEHKAVRRIVIVWALWIITLVVLRVTDDVSLITAASAALVSTLVGILTVPIGFYFKRRGDEDKK
jgi:hypothetical protein